MARNKKRQEKEPAITVPKLNLSQDTKRGVAVVIFVGLAVITALASFGIAGKLGARLMQGLNWGFGILAFTAPLFFALIAVLLAKQKMPDNKQVGFYWRIYFGSLLLFGAIAGIVHTFYLSGGESALGLAQAGKGGGFLGAFFGGLTFKFFGFIAANVILFALLIIGILIAFDIALHVLWPKKQSEETEIRTVAGAGSLKINTLSGGSGFVKDKVMSVNPKISPETTEEVMRVPRPSKTTVSVNSLGKSSHIQLEAITIKDRKDWKLPPFDLLDTSETAVDSGNIEANVAIIKKTLNDFGIEVEMG
ncbi:MAG: DNA translocase FtsK 4TM domain-containing protein, partial [Candidatus Doudnabacteria bacterium]|nr:DNA translocase FtsK 4TM domain-containing protein [Candidatus Doudnabacteria bacterium]